jgi:exosortase
MLINTLEDNNKQFIKRSLLLLVFTTLVILFFYGPLVELFKLSFHDGLHTYIPLVLLASAFLVYLNRKNIFTDNKYSFYAGILLISLGVLLHMFGEKNTSHLNNSDYLSVMTFAALICWAGGFVTFFGTNAFRKASFPLLFLIFMVPVPTALLEVVISLLQRGSTEATYGILKLTGVPLYREKFTFYLPDISIEVARGCSGIRASISLFITTILAGHLFLDKTWSKILLVISTYPITIVKNGLRIATLSLFANYVDPRVLTGWLHSCGGIPFFVLALGLLALILWGLRKIEKRVGAREPFDYQERERDLMRGA